MIPSYRLLLATLIGLLISFCYGVLPVFAKYFVFVDSDEYCRQIFLLWCIYGGVLFFISLIDGLIGFKDAHIQITRLLPTSLAIGSWVNITLEVVHQFKKPTTIEIYDHFPLQTDIKNLPLRVRLLPDQVSTTSYLLKPIQRGDIQFGSIQYRCKSFFGLWIFNRFAGDSALAKVYPDFLKIKKYILLGINDRTSQLGIKLQQRRGTGMDFHRLRKYRIGDSIRQIDWKATSKKRSLISKEYEDRRDQQIFFMMDCSRRMRSKDGNLSHFDHALNSMLLLSYVALHQGDAVGLMSFSSSKNVWLNPIKGTGRINTILNTVYDLHTSQRDSDYWSASEAFFRRQKKRSLVILISNSRDENMDDLISALTMLNKRHLVLFANLREGILDKIMADSVHTFNEALTYAACTTLLQKRSKQLQALTYKKIMTLDTTAQHLPIAIVNMYHKVKRGGQL